MQRYLLIRLLQAVATLAAMTVVVFFLARLTGDPLNVMLDVTATEQDRAIVAAKLGLDQPLPVQYWRFVTSATRGDFGDSLRSKAPALNLVLQRLPATVELALAAMTIAVVVGLVVGVVAAHKRDTRWDSAQKVVALLGQSMPGFWLGIVLIMVFAVSLGLLPSSGRGGPQHYVLPAVTMGWALSAGIMRLTRSSMVDALGSEYATLARIKGLRESVVVWKHCLRNATIPVLTFAGVLFGHALMGSVVTETVFAWPGLGRLMLESVIWRDFPVVQAVVLLFTAIFVTLNLVVDIIYAYVDPRIRY